MAKQRINQEYHCHRCDELLTDENCRRTQDSLSGFSHLCVDCENDFYQSLVQLEGDYIGLFHSCAALNAPLTPMVLEGIQDTFNADKKGWITYINALVENKADTKRGKPLGFKDGAVTQLQRLFGEKLNHDDFVAYLTKERQKIERKEKLPGTDEQRERWGTSPDYRTSADYDELDRLYEVRANSYKGQTITPQMENTLENVVRWSFKMNKLLDEKNPNFHGAKALSDMIDKALASENMRKKDEKPVEHFRMDALVVALEKAGCMENGDFLTYDELIEVLRDNFIKSKKYDQSLDVADQVILDILNAMRSNADLMQLTELPFDLAVEDAYGEFEPEETEEEKRRKEFAGLTKVQFTSENNDDNGEK
ncbi:MAG: hypothetical protein J1E81_06070 [Eubacterium sp.]|nr:hypothetical protein [Eubacterium sp.]